MNKKKLLSLLVVGAMGFGSLQAVPIFTEDFSGVDSGTNVTTTNTAYAELFNGGTTTQTGTTDTGNIFGEGTSNIYNRSVDTDGSNSVRINKDNLNITADVATYSWDLNDSGTAGGYAFRLATSNNAESDYSVQVNFSPATGSIIGAAGVYSTNTTYRFDLVANTGASTVNFNDGNGTSRSVGADRFSLFMTSLDRTTQTLLQDNVAFNGTENGAGFDSIAFQSFNGADGVDVAWDNVVVQDTLSVTTVIPEPSTFALIGFVLAGVIVRMRSRK